MGDVILTTDHVDAWKRERTELVARIKALDAKLGAAEILMADDTSDADPVSAVKSSAPAMQSDTDEGQSISLVKAIIAVLKRFGDEPMTNHAILNRLWDVGYDPSKMHKNYYYTATKRLSDRGLIIKNAEGHYLLPGNGLPAGGSEAKAEKASDPLGFLNPNPAQTGA